MQLLKILSEYKAGYNCYKNKFLRDWTDPRHA